MTAPRASTIPSGSTTFAPTSAGSNFSSLDASYLNNTHGTSGQQLTMGDFGSLFGTEETGVFELSKTKAVSSFYTTLQEVYKGHKIPLLSTILDNVLAVNACNPILAIVSPYLRTLAQVATYEMLSLNIFPAQPTLNGVSERTNTFQRTKFAVSTRQYGINAIMPVDILCTPFENQFRRNITMLMMGLSLAYTFIQVVMVYFVMHATIGSYVSNFGYNFKAGTCNMAQVDATDRRYIGVGNDGPDAFLRAIDLHVRTLTHLEGREKTFVLTTPDVGVYLSTQLGTKQITDVETYIGYVQRTELQGPILAAKKTFKIPPGQTGWQLPTGGTILLPVPTLPISTKINLPHLLRQLTATPQFYYRPQRSKLSSNTDPEKNTIGIYNLSTDDYDFIKPSAFLARSGAWDTQTGHFSARYRMAVEAKNPPKGSNATVTPPTVGRKGQLDEVRRATPTESDIISIPGFVGSMPFTTFDMADQVTKLSTEFHDISEDTYPVSASIRGGRDLMNYFGKDLKKIKVFLDMAKPLLDTAPHTDYVDALLSANDLTAAKQTTWSTGMSTYSTCLRDLGSLTVPDKVPVNMLGVGFAHVPESIRQLGNIEDLAAGPALDKVNRMVQILDNFGDATQNGALTCSSAFRRCPNWVQDQSAGAALVSNFLGGIPAFAKSTDAPEKTKELNTYSEVMEMMSKVLGGPGAKSPAPEFDHRVGLLGLLGNEARTPETFNRIDYLLSKGLSGIGTPALAKTAWGSPDAVNFSYIGKDISKEDSLMLGGLGGIASCIAMLHILHPELKEYVKFTEVLSEIKDGKTDSVSSIVITESDANKIVDKFGRVTTLGNLLKGQPALKYVTGIEKLAGQFMRTSYVRLPFVLSHVGWKKYLSGDGTKKIFPGDYRNGYATHVDKAEFLKQLEGIKTTAAGATNGSIFQGMLSSGRRHDEGTAAGSMATTSAYGARHVGLVHGISNTVNPAHSGIYQSKQLSDVTQNRLAAILQRFSGNANEALLTAIYLHIFMPTDLFTVGTLADAGIWVPCDWAGLRVIISDTSSALILADGCGQMIINPPHVAQRTDSVSNNATMKATIHVGVRPTQMGSMAAIRGAFMHRNLYGLNTKFMENPEKMRLQIDRAGNTQNQACLFAMILAPTEDLGDCFSWAGNTPAPDTMILSRLDGATPCRRMPAVFEDFYRTLYATITQATKGITDRRMALIKSFYATDGNVMIGDGDAHLRRIADGHLADDLWIKGPCASFERGQLQTNSGHGPFGGIHHQAKGAGPCWRGSVHYFPQHDPRRVGQVAI